MCNFGILVLYVMPAQREETCPVPPLTKPTIRKKHSIKKKDTKFVCNYVFRIFLF